MINQECQIEKCEVKLSGVVRIPSTPHHSSDAQENWIINSFRETRFQNVLKRATISPKTSWFWHHNRVLHLSEAAIAVIACNISDYIQILTKRYQLVYAAQELDPDCELLLLISPELDFVVGIVLKTGDIFSTHIIFVDNREGKRNEESSLYPFVLSPWASEDLALCSNNSDRRY